MVPVSKDFFQGGVGNQISENGFTHRLNVSIGVTSLHVFVTPERAVVVSVDRPKGKASDDDSLHLFGHVVGSELNLLNFRWEFDITVSDSKECFQADSGLDLLSVPDDYKPLVGLSLNESVFDEEPKTASCDEEATNAPDVARRTQKDGGEETTCETVDGKELIRQVQFERHKICSKFRYNRIASLRFNTPITTIYEYLS